MADNLWRHALDTLDHYKDPDGGADISHLYEYEENDTTGILKRHKTLVNNVTSEPKTMYFELIKMLMDFEKQHSNQEAYQEIQSISKIQGYQDLTNRLLRNINEKLFSDLQAVSDKLNNIETIMGVSSDNFVWDQQPWAEKFAHYENALEEHNVRFNGVEGENNRQNEDIANLFDRLRTKDEEDDKRGSINEEQVILQAKTLKVLEERIDANEEHIDLLEKHDSEQDDKIEDLTKGWENMENQLAALEKHDSDQDEKIEELSEACKNIDNKQTELEKADTYIQEAHTLLVEKVQGIGEDVQKKEYKDAVIVLKEDFQTYQETKDINDEKTLGMIDTLKENEQTLTDGVEELKKDNLEMKEKLEELVGDTKNLEGKAEEMLEEIEKFKEHYKSLEADQTDGLSGTNERLIALDELLRKLTSELEGVKEKGIHTANEINVLHDENEKHKDDLKSIENDAATFQEKVYITINDNKEDADQTSKKVSELAEDVKENTEKIEALDKNNNIILNKIEIIQQEEADRVKGIADKSGDLEAELKRIDNDVKGNASKIEDGNVIIKRHSEQLYLIEPMAQDNAEAVKEIEDKLKNFEKEQNDQDQKIASIENELGNKQGSIDQLIIDKNNMNSKLEDVDDANKYNRAKIEGLEEMLAKETETKIERTYVENLETRVSVMAEQAQQSEAKLKEDMDAKQDEIIRENKDNLDKLMAQYNQLHVQTETNTTDIKVYKDELEDAVKENTRKIDEMNVTIDTHYHELSDKTNDHVNQIQGLWDNNKSVEDGLKILKDSDEELRHKIAAIEKAKDELARELEKSVDSTNHSLEAIQNHVHKVDELGIDTKDKVDNLEPIVREHGLAIERLEEQVGAIPEQLNNVKNELQQGIDNQNEVIVQFKEAHEKDITNLEEKIKGILESLSQLDKDDIDELMKARKDLDGKLEELEARMQEAGDVTSNTLNVSILELKNENEKALEELEKKMDSNIKDLAGELEEELKTAKGNLETTQDMLLTTIDDVKTDTEKNIGELEVKLNDAVLELYNKDIHGIKEDLDSIKGETKRNESELENVSNLVQNVQINIGEVRTQAQDADFASKDQIRKLRKFYIYIFH